MIDIIAKNLLLEQNCDTCWNETSVDDDRLETLCFRWFDKSRQGQWDALPKENTCEHWKEK